MHRRLWTILFLLVAVAATWWCISDAGAQNQPGRPPRRWREGPAASQPVPSWLRWQPPASTQPATVVLDTKPLPSSPGYHVIRVTMTHGQFKITLACGLFLPPAYFTSKEPFPIVMTLQNRYAIGADIRAISGEGLAMIVSRDNWDTRGTGDRPKQPINIRADGQFICIAPQCPSGYVWETAPMPKVLGDMVGLIAAAYRTDEDRAYLTGFSYGGTCTWRVAMQIPDRFAAIVPIASRAPWDPQEAVDKLKNMGVWLSVGGSDDFLGEAQLMNDWLKKGQHPNFVYEVVPNGNHFCYGSTYTDPKFWQWLLAQRRRHGVATTQPAAHHS